MLTNSLYDAFVPSPKRPSYSFLETSEEIGDEDRAEESGQPVEKKRRLSIQQVKALEKSFELENKLDPERKLRLARELGLQPRQVAVWFQNRRARWKTKQLERDYDVLKADYDTLQAGLNALLQEKEMLQTQVMELKQKLHQEDGPTFNFDNRKVVVDSRKNPEVSFKIERGHDQGAPNSISDIVQKVNGDTCNIYPISVGCKMPLGVNEGSATGSDSDDSEILDVEISKHGSMDGGTACISPMHHQSCSEILALGGYDAGLLHLENEYAYGKVHQPFLCQRGAVKLEDGVSYTDENCNYFLCTGDQAGTFSCWDWT